MKLRRHRFRLISLMIAVCVLLLSAAGLFFRWQDQDRWSSRSILAESEGSIPSGEILDRKETVLASTADGARLYQSDADRRAATVHLLGDRDGLVSGGVESLHSGYLYPSRPGLIQAITALFQPAEESVSQMHLTVSADLCAEIPAAFSGRLQGDYRGAAVIVQYQTGEILGLSSLPSFDPDHPDGVRNGLPDRPELNRAVLAMIPLTGTQTGQILPKDPISSDYRDLQPDPSSEITASPLFLSMVAAAAGNDGVIREPRLIHDIRTSAGATLLNWTPGRLLGQMDADTLTRLQQRMREGVQGDGSAAEAAVATLDIRGLAESLPDPEHPEQFVSWFFGYSAQTDFPYALCVLWENAPDALSGRIGTARIARDLFQWIRNHPDL